MPYDAPEISEDTKEKFIENRNVISVSGVQIKVGLIQVGNKLRLSESGEQSTHILKTAVAELPNGRFSCANEHLTMQLAGQVFGIETAANALIFFKNGEAAYITKRFDVLPNKMKLKMEDFASLAKKSPADGGNFKYDFSYAELGALIRKVVPAWHVEIEKFFSIVLFNYLFCNGDAHLKIFRNTGQCRRLQTRARIRPNEHAPSLKRQNFCANQRVACRQTTVIRPASRFSRIRRTHRVQFKIGTYNSRKVYFEGIRIGYCRTCG